MSIPSLADLNQLSCARVQLLMLRCLSTSDLSWHADLFSKSFCTEMAKRALKSLAPENEPDLSDAEVNEFKLRCTFLLNCGHAT